MNTQIIFTITKREVETLDFTRFEQAFGFWPELRGDELRRRFDSLILVVDGYNQDLQEIYAIPEVRKYYTELHRRWPWWAFFLANIEAQIAVNYLCLLSNIQTYKEAAFNPDELLTIIGHDFCRMNHLFERAGMSVAENDRRSDEILKIFTENMGGVRNG